MLSIFPTLLSYNQLVPFIFRLLTGVVFLSFAYSNITKNQEEKAKKLEHFKLKPGKIWLLTITSIEGIGGILLITGLYIQLTSLIFSIFLILGHFAKYRKSEFFQLSHTTLFLLLLITSSLLFLGPGFYSIDLPF